MKLIKKLIVLTLMLTCGILCANVDINALRKSADRGDAKAQFNLGWYYEKGKGVKQDSAEAVKWYRKAADQGHAKAQCKLGVCYFYGYGVKQDYAEAVKWYFKASKQGDTRAAEALKKLLK